MKALQRMIRFMDAYWGVAIIGLLTVILPVAMELMLGHLFVPLHVGVTDTMSTLLIVLNVLRSGTFGTIW